MPRIEKFALSFGFEEYRAAIGARDKPAVELLIMRGPCAELEKVYPRDADAPAAVGALKEQLFELMTNAVDAGATKMEIDISEDTEDTLAGRVYVQISDDGDGIPEDLLGQYDPAQAEGTVSRKQGVAGMLGGKNKALYMTSLFLQKHGDQGTLVLMQRPRGEKGAHIVMESSMAPCGITIEHMKAAKAFAVHSPVDCDSGPTLELARPTGRLWHKKAPRVRPGSSKENTVPPPEKSWVGAADTHSSPVSVVDAPSRAPRRPGL